MDVLLDGEVKSLEVLKTVKLLIYRCILRAELHLVRQTFALCLYCEVVCSLVVCLVLCGEPYHLPFILKTRENISISLFIIEIVDDRLDFSQRRLVLELMLHIVSRAILILLHIEPDAPIISDRICTLEELYVRTTIILSIM